MTSELWASENAQTVSFGSCFASWWHQSFGFLTVPNQELLELPEQSLTCFGSRLGSEVCSKLLEHLSTLLLDEKPDEVGGRVELQGQRGREFAFPAHHRGLQGFREGIDLAVLALPREAGQALLRKGRDVGGCQWFTFPLMQ